MNRRLIIKEKIGKIVGTMELIITKLKATVGQILEYFATFSAWYLEFVDPILFKYKIISILMALVAVALGIYSIRYLQKREKIVKKLKLPYFLRISFFRPVLSHIILALQFVILYFVLLAIAHLFPLKIWPKIISVTSVILVNLFIVNLYIKALQWLSKNKTILILKINLLSFNLIKVELLKKLLRQLFVFSVSLAQFLVTIFLLGLYIKYLETSFDSFGKFNIAARLPGIFILIFLIHFRASFMSIYSDGVDWVRKFIHAVSRDFDFQRITLVRKDQVEFLMLRTSKAAIQITFSILLYFIVRQAITLSYLGKLPPAAKKSFEIILYLGIVYFLWKFYRWFVAAWKNQKNHVQLYSRIIKLYLNIDRYSPFNAVRFDPFISTALKTINILVIGLTAYIGFGVVLRMLPATRRLSTILFGHIIGPVNKGLDAILGFLPNMFIIGFVIILMNYVMDFVKFFFREIEVGHIKFQNFHTEFASPTYKIVRFLILVFGIVIIFPYLPGAQSPAFKGISVFLGILFSLGSSSVVANLMAGLLITYMRPFKIGDRVKIADTMGDVVEKNLLVTRIKTTKNIFVAIPNALILGAHITNFSFKHQEVPIIVHTKITIGYDVPWAKVQDLLVSAALASKSILPDPKPFVLQTELSDFYVEYEINAYTKSVSEMTTIYSDLHKNIQESFAKAKVEIMSPHYRVNRTSELTTVPALP